DSKNMLGLCASSADWARPEDSPCLSRYNHLTIGFETLNTGISKSTRVAPGAAAQTAFTGPNGARELNTPVEAAISLSATTGKRAPTTWLPGERHGDV